MAALGAAEPSFLTAAPVHQRQAIPPAVPDGASIEDIYRGWCSNPVNYRAAPGTLESAFPSKRAGIPGVRGTFRGQDVVAKEARMLHRPQRLVPRKRLVGAGAAAMAGSTSASSTPASGSSLQSGGSYGGMSYHERALIQAGSPDSPGAEAAALSRQGSQQQAAPPALVPRKSSKENPFARVSFVGEVGGDPGVRKARAHLWPSSSTAVGARHGMPLSGGVGL
eukprot:TRINITY_DN30579_c0_g1_i1.p1 TRINITY_DN30579_c0_g1~~TRINITY_DN30579_c0_g1_i1.p1  ORF type:complete len:223 (+),score=37.78 TRINITY_DN30579_c0_g1_i1:80-748(+)